MREELVIRNLSCVGMDAQPSGDPPSYKRFSVFQGSFAYWESLRRRIVEDLNVSAGHDLNYNSF